MAKNGAIKYEGKEEAFFLVGWLVDFVFFERQGFFVYV